MCGVGGVHDGEDVLGRGGRGRDQKGYREGVKNVVRCCE